MAYAWKASSCLSKGERMALELDKEEKLLAKSFLLLTDKEEGLWGWAEYPISGPDFLAPSGLNTIPSDRSQSE
nr:hypothetical protein CFP56_64465 [Quercus suber]